MKQIFTALGLCLLVCTGAIAQTGVGIGIYPTGTETGIGFRSGKNSRFFIEACVTKANRYKNPANSSFLSEVSAVTRGKA